MLAVANLVAIAVGASLLSNWTQWLLMPILSIAFVALARGATGLDPRLRTATLAALGFSWLGDLLPHLAPDSVAFLVMVGCFLLAQVAYIVGFLPTGVAASWSPRDPSLPCMPWCSSRSSPPARAALDRCCGRSSSTASP
jgi:uncharacterized membrane protein YhhN